MAQTEISVDLKEDDIDPRIVRLFKDEATIKDNRLYVSVKRIDLETVHDGGADALAKFVEPLLNLQYYFSTYAEGITLVFDFTSNPLVNVTELFIRNVRKSFEDSQHMGLNIQIEIKVLPGQAPPKLYLPNDNKVSILIGSSTEQKNES